MGTMYRMVGGASVRAGSTGLFGPSAGLPRSSALLAPVLCWIDRARQRRALQALDDRLLKDIGLTRAEVEQEISKPFWRI